MFERERAEEGLGAGGRAVVYCLVPFELADRLHEPLRKHFEGNSGVEVVVERREANRRARVERRRAKPKAKWPTAKERRGGAGDRRIADRRVPLASPEGIPALPRRFRRYASHIAFVQRIEPSTQEREDRDTARLVARFQAGDRAAFDILYKRFFDRVHGYLRLALGDAHEAEDATQEVFARLLGRIGSYKRQEQPFRAWLFTIVRNMAIDFLRRRHAIVVEDPEFVDRIREQSEQETPELEAMNWISDRDLLLFLDRLPEAQRQALLLRFTLDLSAEQIAHLLGRSDDDVRMLQHRGLNFLRDRLTAIGRAPKQSQDRSRSRRLRPQQTVIRSRRWSL